MLVKRVNGHTINDIVALDTDQTITAPINFRKGFEIPSGDLKVEKINNITWKSVREKGLHPAILELQNLEKDVKFLGNATIAGILISEIRVGNESLDALLDDLICQVLLNPTKLLTLANAHFYILLQDENHVEITGKKTIQSLSTEDLHVAGYINSKKLLDEVLTSDTDQAITGRYEFKNGVSFSNLEIRGELNSYHVTELLDSVIRVDELDQPVECQLHFEDLTVNNGITVNGEINGISMADILLDGVDQTFTAPQTLISPNFTKLTVDGNLALADPATLVNSFDLDLFDRKRATISTDQWINANWHLNEANISSLSLWKLNGLTLEEWRNNFLHGKSSTAQVIKADGIEIDKLEIRGNISTLDKGINDFDWKKYSHDAADVRGNVTIKTDVTFKSLEARQFFVSGTLNNASLKELAKDSVFGDLKQNITGIKRFSTIKITGNVEADLINGAQLLKSYLHKNADQHIEAPMRFTVLSAEDVDLSGSAATLNGVPRDLIFSSAARAYNVHLGDVVFENSIDIKSLQVQSFLNEDWEELVSSIAYVDRFNNFTEAVNFTKPVKVFSNALYCCSLQFSLLSFLFF